MFDRVHRMVWGTKIMSLFVQTDRAAYSPGQTGQCGVWCVGVGGGGGGEGGIKIKQKHGQVRERERETRKE